VAHLDLTVRLDTIGNVKDLAALPDLEYINLGGCNKVEGNISSLCSLTNLRTIKFFNCKEVGGYLKDLAVLKDLEKADFTYCPGVKGDKAALKMVLPKCSVK